MNTPARRRAAPVAPTSPAAARARLRPWRGVLAAAVALTVPCVASAGAAPYSIPVNYPASPRGPQVDVYHGTPVPDPYRWLEDLDAPATAAWVAAQNELAFGFLATLPQREKFRARLTELWNYERFGVPEKEGGRLFYSRNSGLQNQAVYHVEDRPGAAPRVLIDPNTLAADGTVALTATRVSPDGRWVAYGTAAAGSDWNEFRIRSVDTAHDEPDVLRWVKFSGLSWTQDARGFFYSRYPEPGAATGTGATFGELGHQRLYYHRLGTPQSEDRLIHAVPAEPKWFVRGGVTEDGRYLVIAIARGSAPENLLRVVDLGDPLAPRLDAPVLSLVETWDAEYSVVGNDGPVLYVLTTAAAPRRRLIAIDLRRPEPAHWRTVIPEGPDVIDSVDAIGGRFVVRTMRDASSRLTVHARDGALVREIALPGIGTVATVRGRDDDPELFYSFTSFATPATIHRDDVAEGGGAVYRAPQVAFDPSRYETRQVFYRSKDGTRVPMFLTHRRGLVPDGTTPAILYGYGGFNISLTPAFSVSIVAWLEAGGIYAVPNLRGGGEYGQGWHRAGTRERKQNVFDDFIAAAEWLCAEKYTCADRLILSGGSNGGLLVAAVINQRPDLCRVAWPAVGVMDMLRFHRFTVGYAWTSDYGSSDEVEGFRYLSAYSPLHHVKAGVRYPAVLVTTADHDDRVHPAHSFKYAAALQHAAHRDLKNRPVLIRIETRAGHGAGKPTRKLIEEAADRLAFGAHFVGLAGPAASP